jgi:hypothetical protein
VVEVYVHELAADFDDGHGALALLGAQRCQVAYAQLFRLREVLLRHPLQLVFPLRAVGFLRLERYLERFAFLTPAKR